MGSTIIGIDHGYKNMKSANAMFATRLSRLDSKPDEMQMDGVIEFEGVYYTIYGSPLAAVNHHIKSESEEYYILTLASVGEEFRARGILPGPNKIHVRLGCGLPQKWYDRQKESFKAMLWKNKEIRFSYGGNTYNVVIDNVTVYMQGFAALPVLECITQKSEYVVLVDIGGETVDVIVCEGFHPLLDKCRIDTRATIALLKDIDSELQSELGETIPEQDGYEIFDPNAIWKKKSLKNFYVRSLLVQIFDKGECVYESPSLDEIRRYCKDQIETLWEETLRFENPQTYYVDLSKKLWSIKQDILHRYTDL